MSIIYARNWQSKGISNEKVTAPAISTSNDQAPILEYDGKEISLKFIGDLLKQSRVTYNHGSKVSIFIVYKLNSHTINTDLTLRNCLYGALKMTKNSDVEKYKYSGYGIGFDSIGSFSHSDGNNACNVIIFDADLSKKVHSSNKPSNILVLGKSIVQELNGKTLYAEEMYPVNFTVTDKNFCLSLHYDGSVSRLFVNGKRKALFTTKDSEISPCPLCLRNISKDFSSPNTQKPELNGHVYDFSVEYGVFSDFEIQDIHTYLMSKNSIV